MIKKLIEKFKSWRASVKRKKEIEEIKKQDPFIYK
jgi:hypothetical protein